jgi:ESAT-6 protein secretion system EspG family protein
MLSRPVTVTATALSDMLRIHGVGEPPAAIRPDPTWSDPVSEHEAERAAWREFADVHLVDRPGRLSADALDALHALARPSVAYIGVVLGKDSGRAVVVAARGDEAIAARRAGDAVTLTSVCHRSLPETLLRRIPDARPAPIDAINVRIDDLATHQHGDPFGGGSPTAQDVRSLYHLTERRLVGQGELYVAVRDAYGRQHRGSPIRYQDYRIGRVALFIGGGYLSVAPATKILLRDRLQAAHQDLVG